MPAKTIIIAALLVAVVPLHAGALTASTNSCVYASGFTRNLAVGSRGSDVIALQQYLAASGYYSGPVTGYFGRLTLGAVVSFQRSNGLPAFGFFGTMTRGVIGKRCGGQPLSGNATMYSITPASGAVGSEVTIDGFGFTSDNTIHFGSGVVLHVPISSSIAIACTTNPSCRGGIHQTLKFTVPSTLGPACTQSNPPCMVPVRAMTPGVYDVYVENQNGSSNHLTYRVTNGTASSTVVSPYILSVAPQQAANGTKVSISGSGFTQGAVIQVYRSGQEFGTIGGVTVTDTTHLSFAITDYIGAFCHVGSVCIALAKQFPAGSYTIAVETGNGESNQISFAKTL